MPLHLATAIDGTKVTDSWVGATLQLTRPALTHDGYDNIVVVVEREIDDPFVVTLVCLTELGVEQLTFVHDRGITVLSANPRF